MATLTGWRLVSDRGLFVEARHARVGIVVGLAAEARIARRLGWAGAIAIVVFIYSYPTKSSWLRTLYRLTEKA